MIKETHCIEIIKHLYDSIELKTLNYIYDGLESEFIWKDNIKYKIIIKPIFKNEIEKMGENYEKNS